MYHTLLELCSKPTPPQEEPPIDLEANHAKLSAIDNDIETAREKLNVFLRELGLDEI